MWLLGFEKLWLHAAVTAALAGAVAHILFLIQDLDDAFAGSMQVSKAAFVRARRHFDRSIIITMPRPSPMNGASRMNWSVGYSLVVLITSIPW